MAYRYRRRDPETGQMELYEDAGRSIPVNFGGMNLTGTPNFDYLQNLANLAQQQQGPQLGPDDFGSYSIPMSDPTYSSGFDYARSIAGGMPMSQVIAPGVSYSPEQPMGYTQEQLNTAVGTTPVEPPQKLPGPGEEGYGQGIGGVTIFDDVFDKKRMPPRDISGGTRDIRDVPTPLSSLPRFDYDEMAKNIRESGIDFTNLFGMPKFDIPTVDEGVGTGGGFIGGPVTASDTPFTGAGMAGAGARPDLPPPTESALFGTLPPIGSIENIIQDPRMANIPTPPMDLPIDLPNIMDVPPAMPPINIPPVNSIENIVQDPRMANIPNVPVDLPPINIMDLPPVNMPPVIEMPPMRNVGRPNQDRFSIQQLPRGLF